MHKPLTLEGWQVWDLVGRLGGQLRVTPGAVIGWDMSAALALGTALGLSPPAMAELLPVVEAVMVAKSNRQYHEEDGQNTAFSVTLAHPDTGWDHFADAWRVELADGTVLGERVLVHPHEAEQPFTRSLSGVAIPEGVGQVFIRSRK